MNIHEYQAKELFKNSDIPIPLGRVAFSAADPSAVEFVMEIREELFAAITTAVLAYIMTQEKQQLALAQAMPALSPPVSESFWAASGRQAMMDMRRTLQLGLTRLQG